jgi:hypothetical protein
MSQLISWGITYYLIGAFGDVIAKDLGWSGELVYGGFSFALLIMGVSSSLVGRLIDQYGGRRAMNIGALLNAAGCLGLCFCYSLPVYFLAWLLLGLGMRLTLYDAAFAALARTGGPEARGPMAQITLLGGLASTVIWPVGFMLAEAFGWRGALACYAGFALLTIPLHLTLPKRRYVGTPPNPGTPAHRPLAASGRERTIAAALYALIITVANFLNSGMSAHMIAILGGLGLAASTAVWSSTLRGIGQSLARLGEVLFGRRIDPITLSFAAAVVLPCAFIAGFLAAYHWSAALAFAFFYGAGNGILTITRGTMPLVLFDHRTYGAFVGRLLAPSFIVSAAAPLVYAVVIARYGEGGALYLSIAVSTLAAIAAFILKYLFNSSRKG